MEKTIHQGRNLKRFREILGIKQEGLAYELGDEWNQKKVSILESKERIDRDVLEQLSAIMKIPVDVFQRFEEEKAINVISSTFNDSAAVVQNNPVFNPIDKIIQLHEEKIALYERMLTEKEEMMARLERLISQKAD